MDYFNKEVIVRSRKVRFIIFKLLSIGGTVYSFWKGIRVDIGRQVKRKLVQKNV